MRQAARLHAVPSEVSNTSDGQVPAVLTHWQETVSGIQSQALGDGALAAFGFSPRCRVESLWVPVLWVVRRPVPAHAVNVFNVSAVRSVIPFGIVLRRFLALAC